MFRRGLRQNLSEKVNGIFISHRAITQPVIAFKLSGKYNRIST